MIDDDELQRRLLSYIGNLERKAARVIMSVFDDIDYECTSMLLYGFGDEAPDRQLDRCIELLTRFASDGRIDVFGDLSQPRFSEVRLAKARSR